MSGPSSLDDHETLVRLAQKRVNRAKAKIAAEEAELAAAQTPGASWPRLSARPNATG